MREVKEELKEAERAGAGGNGVGAASPAETRDAKPQGDGRETTKPTGAPAKASSLHPLVELTKSRVREFVREPEAVFWVFVFPVLLAFALGIAFRNTAPEKVRVAVETEGVSASASASLAESLRRSPDVEVLTLSGEEARQALRSGRVALVVRPQEGAGTTRNDNSQATNAAPPPDTAQTSPNSGSPAAFEYRFDPTRPDSRTARLVVDDALQRAAGRPDVAAATDVRVTEPGARYIDFLIPGLIGMNLMGSGLWGVGFAIVTARMRKLLKRLSATSMRRSHYLASFVLSRMLFLTLEVACVLVFAWLVFGYTIRGSLLEM
ncbi:MAG TPA: ABC transporter permease, partial [Pyrinomonadaceae bacterium]|nr:ABC transporter permease [Pyrinomonadaceae bacterium]